MREWRAANSERLAAYDKEYKDAHKDQQRASAIEYRAKNADKIRQTASAYYEKHKARLNAPSDKSRARRRRYYRNNSGKERLAARNKHPAHYAAHREAILAYQADYYMSTGRSVYLEKTYGITLSAYNTMLDDQGGLCAICYRPGPSGKPLSVDHCHETGVVRALLCQGCNCMLGFARDDSERLRASAAYVDKHRSGGGRIL
jgi:hypothetical protein